MCGVFGIVTKKKTKAIYDFLTALAIETESRGQHATGIAHIGKHSKIKSSKAPLPASDFVTRRQWTWMKNNMPERMIGHCRHTTKGSESINKNNHPHVGKRYALIHNGVLKHYEYSPWKELCKSDCDSEAILRVMELGQSMVKGAARAFNCFYDSNFAVMMLDRTNKDLIFFRNPGRPLRVWRAKDFTVIGSTEEILEAAFQKVFQVASDKVKGLEKWTPKSGVVYRIDRKMEVKKTELFDYSVTVNQTVNGQTVQNQTALKNSSNYTGPGWLSQQDKQRQSKEKQKELPLKVQQYQHYNFGSKGYGKPNKIVKFDNNGNMICDVSADLDWR